MLEKIASGNADWIDTSACLAIGAAFSPDMKTRRALNIAWAKALPKSPAAILELEGEYGLSTVRACSMPFDQAEPEFIESYREAALRALKTVTGQVMEAEREDCEKHLRKAYERFKAGRKNRKK